MNTKFIPFVTPPARLSDPATWYLFHDRDLLLQVDNGRFTLPTARDQTTFNFDLDYVNYLGFLEGEPRKHCYAAELAADAPLPKGMEAVNLRRVYGRIPDELFWVAARAVQVVDWDRTHRFCSRCAVPLALVAHERTKKCPECDLSFYPRLHPAMIVRVTKIDDDGDKILLAHNARFPRNFYSVLAGFVEPGETLEECVRREVWEEVGLEVNNVRYFGSQPWPFPHSLMIAFTAEYVRGAITVDEVEIAHAAWFTADDLPQVPPPLSIARQLIDDFVARQQA